jgi:CheY-like chemotaxis protein
MTSPRGGRRRKPTVLLVDGDYDARQSYGRYLVNAGFDLVHTSTGVEAIEYARSEQPDVVLMDLSVPGVDGWQTARILKTDLQTRTIPLLVLTSKGSQAPNGNCDGFIAKPCLPAHLVAAIRRVLAPRRRPSARTPPRRTRP